MPSEKNRVLRNDGDSSILKTVVPGCGHDLNNMLTVILGKAGLVVRRESVEPALLREVEAIETCALHARELTGLMLSLLEQRTEDRKPGWIRPDEEIREMLSLYRAICSYDVVLRVDLSAAEATLGMTRLQFRRVVTNLIVNASKSMVRGGQLTLTTKVVRGKRRPGRGLFILKVSDTGRGMDKRTKNEVARICNSAKKRVRLGGGLAFVSQALWMSGGQISFRTQENQGASFEIKLPCVQGDRENHGCIGGTAKNGRSQGRLGLTGLRPGFVL